MQAFFPGTRVIAFDTRLYKDDRITPPSVTMKPATVLCWYARRASPVIGGYPYESLADVRFDHDGRESKGHFTDYLRVM